MREKDYTKEEKNKLARKERREAERRFKGERRAVVRWEPEKKPRRSGKDRRKFYEDDFEAEQNPKEIEE